MIYWCSGFGPNFGKVLVPVTAQIPVSDPDLFNTAFHINKNCTKYCLFNARSSNVSQKVGL
jgi:hypothetical protein